MEHKERCTQNHPFIFVRKSLEGDNPYSHLINLYKSIENQIAAERDPMGWRLVRAELDGILDTMFNIGLLGGRDEQKAGL